jgi:hypothetical protein
VLKTRDKSNSTLCETRTFLQAIIIDAVAIPISALAYVVSASAKSIATQAAIVSALTKSISAVVIFGSAPADILSTVAKSIRA